VRTIAIRRPAEHLGVKCLAGAAAVLLTASQTGFAQAGNPFPSTYEPGTPTQVLIVRATILDGTGRRLDDASLLLRDGRIAAIGADLEAPSGAEVIDASGRWVTPGIIDPHSHLGSASFPLTPQELTAWDVSEVGDPVAPHLYVEASVHAQDPGFAAALAGGVTRCRCCLARPTCSAATG
jgi:imidazolonepropionase-like amidohydrolase